MKFLYDKNTGRVIQFIPPNAINVGYDENVYSIGQVKEAPSCRIRDMIYYPIEGKIKEEPIKK